MDGEKKKALPVFITEEHNNVVPFIHRAIASKKLPFTNIPMVHLDSHPDLLISQHLQADTVFKPKELYESVSIENWLLPQVFAKHLNPVVWVKPPWANQIKASSQRFLIGKCRESGLLRVTSRENYFLTDALHRSKADLTETCDVHLLVLELKPKNWPELDPSYPTDKDDAVQDSDSTPFTDHKQWTNRLQDELKDKRYILDIDLDFFSTQNPFKDLFGPEAEGAVRRLYHFASPEQLSDEDLKTLMEERELQLTVLEDLWSGAEQHWSDCKEKPSELICDTRDLTELLGTGQDSLEGFTDDQLSDIRTVVTYILTGSGDTTFTQVHDFGCTLDDTELPHHVSTNEQVEALNASFSQVLETLPPPTIVTIARSSTDEYCPPSKVDQYEKMVLQLLEKHYGKLQITKDIS